MGEYFLFIGKTITLAATNLGMESSNVHDNNKGNCITSHLRMIHLSLALENSFNFSISTSANILTICHQKPVHECNSLDFGKA